MSDDLNKEIGRGQAYFTYKRCPYCYTHLKLNAEHCMECRKKVGEVDKLGLARKPFNYKAYFAAALWVILLAIYFWKIIFNNAVEFINK